MKLANALRWYPGFMRDASAFRQQWASGPAVQRQGWGWMWHPILGQNTATSEFDAHYVYMGGWAMHEIAARQPAEHVDVGSSIAWIVCLAAVVKVVFIDIRPFDGAVPNLTSRAGSVLAMPYADRSVPSLSCLHVAEHIGLGRYGDPIDPEGTRKAIHELARILATGGQLYFALPVGQPRICFNAHRVHDPEQIVQWFGEEGLQLAGFDGIGDDRRYYANAKPADFRTANFGCGLYRFTRP